YDRNFRLYRIWHIDKVDLRKLYVLWVVVRKFWRSCLFPHREKIVHLFFYLSRIDITDNHQVGISGNKIGLIIFPYIGKRYVVDRGFGKIFTRWMVFSESKYIAYS